MGSAVGPYQAAGAAQVRSSFLRHVRRSCCRMNAALAALKRCSIQLERGKSRVYTGAKRLPPNTGDRSHARLTCPWIRDLARAGRPEMRPRGFRTPVAHSLGPPRPRFPPVARRRRRPFSGHASVPPRTTTDARARKSADGGPATTSRPQNAHNRPYAETPFGLARRTSTRKKWYAGRSSSSSSRPPPLPARSSTVRRARFTPHLTSAGDGFRHFRAASRFPRRVARPSSTSGINRPIRFTRDQTLKKLG